ncbi:MAG: 3-deoxy-manno-octulosonate cytidylyltransferase [Bacteroidota bacterium]
MKVLAVIPARFASQRLPGKVLEKIGEKTMLQHVYERVKEAKRISKILIATDDVRIEKEALKFGADIFVSVDDHDSGTSRCFEAANHEDFDLLINIQGDEPFIDASILDELLFILNRSDSFIGTAICPISNPKDLNNPNVVKVAINDHHDALLFSRNCIPYVRDKKFEDWMSIHTFYKHHGIYAFKKEGIELVKHLTPTVLEKAESLEQLRWLENGLSIKCIITEHEAFGVDTMEDLIKARTML